MPFHVPVLCHAVLEALVTHHTGLYVDATVGGGGHSAAILDVLGASATVIGIDRDEEALAVATGRLGHDARFSTLHGNFGDMETLLVATGAVDGLLLDLGVSSHQLDTGRRGFSHRMAASLDMRMDTSSRMTAAEVVNTWEEGELRRALFAWGEESLASPISRAIVAARPVRSTTELARVVRSAVPLRREARALARVFQAIRIAVNDELGCLERALLAGSRVVKTGGRMVVISYHSLEDRRVKRMFRHGNLRGEPIRDLYGTPVSAWRALTQKPVFPDPEEVAANPRARSARLRAAEKTSQPSR